MFDLDFSKLAVIGVVALVVIGPEKLPRVARTLGALIGKAQRYVSDVKAEVNRQVDLEELQKMKQQMESAAKEVESSVESSVIDFEKDWQATTQSITKTITANHESTGAATSSYADQELDVPLQYKHPQKKWRIKQSAMPQWFKARQSVRRKALSGAARVARYRPKLK